MKRKCGNGCKGCVYRINVSGNGISICDYLSQTGKTRGCPSGKGCDKYKPKNKGVNKND